MKAVNAVHPLSVIGKDNIVAGGDDRGPAAVTAAIVAWCTEEVLIGRVTSKVFRR